MRPSPAALRGQATSLPASASAAAGESYEIVAGDPTGGLVIVCDHASNAIPPDYGDLGLPRRELDRHIAYDIGAGALCRALAERLKAPAVLTRFSRLLVDPNRGEDDPTLIMRLSDGAIVPGNARLDGAERQRRLDRFYRPYHRAIDAAIGEALAAGRPPVLLSTHSFTANWKTTPRPWHAGILWDRDPRLAVPLIAALGREQGLRVGDNEPYSGVLEGDTMFRHGTSRGLAHALLEVRNDLIAEPGGVLEWAERLERVLREILRDAGLQELRFHGSHSTQTGENQR